MNRTNHSLHSAYINDKLISFEEIYKDHSAPLLSGVQILSESVLSFPEIIDKLERDQDWKGVIYLSDSPQRSWEEFVSHFHLQEAAGGIVMNEKEQYLVIFRRGKWDLPKGKIDFDESPEEAALREVMEECGNKKLEIVEPVMATFHSYPHNKKRILKKTHWYLMKGDSTELLIPQEDEDIELVEWMDEKKIRLIVFNNTYYSIKNLLSRYFNHRASFKTDKT